jgi:hypothetical protein
LSLSIELPNNELCHGLDFGCRPQKFAVLRIQIDDIPEINELYHSLCLDCTFQLLCNMFKITKISLGCEKDKQVLEDFLSLYFKEVNNL